MSFQRRVVGLFVAVAVAGGLFWAIAYISYGLWGRDQGNSVAVPMDDRTTQALREEYAHRRQEYIAERYPLASLPWTNRSLSDARASISQAYLPRIMPRRKVSDPDPVALNLARSPWIQRGRRPRPVNVERAYVPSIPRHRSLTNPDAAAVTPAVLPWSRDSRQTAPVSIEPAQIPSQLRQPPKPR